jgi:hypothetical protein
MIQRLQSVYLSLTIILSLLFQTGKVIGFISPENEAVTLAASGIFESQDSGTPVFIMNTMPLTIIQIIIPIVALAAILMYSNRKIQLTLTTGLIIIIIVLIVLLTYYSWSLISSQNMSLTPGIKLACPVIMIILVWLARRRIRRDEEVVRSYDRLR